MLAVYEKDFYAGSPVVTRNSFGKGEAYYLAAESSLDFLRAFYQDLFREAALENALQTKLPYGVTVTERVGDNGKRVVFVMNFKNEPVCVEGIGKWTDAETKEVYEGTLEMKPFQCMILI